LRFDSFAGFEPEPSPPGTVAGVVTAREARWARSGGMEHGRLAREEGGRPLGRVGGHRWIELIRDLAVGERISAYRIRRQRPSSKDGRGKGAAGPAFSSGAVPSLIGVGSVGGVGRIFSRPFPSL
jgi:hypothetical protein